VSGAEHQHAETEGRVRPWLGLAAGLAGGIGGHFLFLWIVGQGFYALVLPGAFVGLAYGLVVKRRCPPFAIACGVLALLAGIVSEWRLSPFLADAGFGYFLTHLHQLRPLTMIMIGLGAAISLRVAWGSRRRGV
jgi:hypothetical protein